jgi:hypothetical protein
VAPEQARGEGLDARADQYSLAALTYLLLAGRPPYSHPTLAAAAAPGPPLPLSTSERPYPAAVEKVVRRGLAADREDRWPDVRAYVDALAAALDGDTFPSEPRARLPRDTQRTQPGAAPSPAPEPAPLPEPVPPRRGRRIAGVLVGLLALAGGAAAGFAIERGVSRAVTVTDDSGSLAVTVPGEWERVVAGRGWRPPNDSGEFPALSVGTDRGWAGADGTGEGVFLGILPGTELPSRVPRHPECAQAQAPVEDSADGDASMTVVYTSCPGGVTVERVVQVAANRLLWVQVRSAERATANEVLDTVETSGL